MATTAAPQSAGARFLSRRGYADAAALLALVVAALVAAAPLVLGGTMLGQDTSTAFYPWFWRLGERLRSGDIPGWNPHGFSGAPFAADPQSGWMYLPAMLGFALLPFALAAKAYVLGHLLLAGVAAYALARALGMGVGGALVAGLAYELTGLMYGRSPCCPNHTGIAAWLPVVLLGAELALRARSWPERGLWWGLSGLGVSQALAIWPGQGTYYVLLVLAAYVAYRTLLDPPRPVHGVRERLLGLVVHGAAPVLFGLALAAAGLLPRVEYNLVSNLAGGYPGTEQEVVGGWGLAQWVNVLSRNPWYAGAATLALALAAPFLARRRYAVPLWAALTLAGLVLTGQGPTPLHSLLYLLPGFGSLHPHEPVRVMTVFYLAPALLAGAAVAAAPDRHRRWAPLLALPPLAVLGLRAAAGARFDGPTLLAALAASALLAALLLLPGRRAALAGALALVVALDLVLSGRALLAQRTGIQGAHAWRKVDLSAHYAPGAAGRYLLGQGEEPFRFFGYDPKIPGRFRTYPPQWTNPRTAALLVNNRATVLGLEDLQGYNPIHVARYDELVRALNGRTQGYRSASVLEEGLGSPLLDLLNTRYVIVPAEPRPARADLRGLIARLPTVHQGDGVRVLERPTALPRAWLVHEARRLPRGEALPLLASGAVDPRRTALLEAEPPPLAPPPDPALDSAAVVEREPDRIRVRTRSAAPALLMLSEITYPAWEATVDGVGAPVLVADHALRAVPVPAGEHEVTLRYDSWTLDLGIAITALAYLALGALAALALRRRSRRRPEPNPIEVGSTLPQEHPGKADLG